ncbi:hypothetical protein HDU96_000494 [Phlyctochytrium bullatum]|nr:hypothetical protein HDU96_000494 [Phlyctochytrium bullatum]
MKSPAAIVALTAAILLGSTSTTAFPSPQPSQNQTAITLAGKASTYNDCSFLRDTANLRCSASFLPYNPPDGPTSGRCITASAAYGDLCVHAVDKNETLPFDYAFRYPSADTPDEDVNDLGLADAITERAINIPASDIPRITNEMAKQVAYLNEASGPNCKTPQTKAYTQCTANFKPPAQQRCKNKADQLYGRCLHYQKVLKQPYTFSMCFPSWVCGEKETLRSVKECKGERYWGTMRKWCVFFNGKFPAVMQECLDALEDEVARCVTGVKREGYHDYWFSPNQPTTWG